MSEVETIQGAVTAKSESEQRKVRVSPSQVHGKRLCKRRWAYRYVEGIPEPQSAAQADGVLGHKRNERWLLHGEHPGDDAMGRLVQAAMRPGYLPTPGRHLLIEHPFEIPLGGGHAFMGYIDCIEPPAEVHRVAVIDYKFVSSFRYILTRDKLRQDPQAVGYGKAAIDLFPTATEIERRWLYFQKGTVNVKPVSVIETVAQVETAWAELKTEANEMVAIRLRKIPANQLEPNTDACHAFNKPCPYSDRCPAFASSRSFTKAFTHKENSIMVSRTQEGDPQMAVSLLAQLDKLKAKVGGAGAGTPTAEAPPPAEAKPAPAATSVPATNGAKRGLSALAELQRLKGAMTANPPEAAMAMAKPVTDPIPDAVVATPAPVAASEEKTMAAEKPKKAKSEKTTPTRLTVMFNAAMVKRPGDAAEPVQLVEVLAPIMRQVADSAQKAHWMLMPYSEGKALLAHAFDQWLETSGWKGTIYVDGASPEAQAVREVLLNHADVVVRGVA